MNREKKIVVLLRASSTTICLWKQFYLKKKQRKIQCPPGTGPICKEKKKNFAKNDGTDKKKQTKMFIQKAIKRKRVKEKQKKETTTIKTKKGKRKEKKEKKKNGVWPATPGRVAGGRRPFWAKSPAILGQVDNKIPRRLFGFLFRFSFWFFFFWFFFLFGLPSFTEFYQSVASRVAEWRLLFSGFLPSLTGFYWVLLGFI